MRLMPAPPAAAGRLEARRLAAVLTAPPPAVRAPRHKVSFRSSTAPAGAAGAAAGAAAGEGEKVEEAPVLLIDLGGAQEDGDGGRAGVQSQDQQQPRQQQQRGAGGNGGGGAAPLL